jgi:hypothetical protein
MTQKQFQVVAYPKYRVIYTKPNSLLKAIELRDKLRPYIKKGVDLIIERVK